MNIANVQINRVIAHEVVRASEFAERPPILSEQLVILDDNGKTLVGKRIVNTVASGSHCVDVTVEDSSTGSPFQRATDMIDETDDQFVELSKLLANDLSNAQTAGPIKSGSAIFVQGTCAADGANSRFVAIIKADSDQGLYKRIQDDGSITLTYVNDMLLGDSQRLIKIAFFIEETSPEEGPDQPRQPEEFSVKVFDHLMQASGDGIAAQYFYQTFLRCRIAHSAARTTKQFFNIVKNYIDELPLPQSEKVSYHGDLISYLRQNATNTIEPRTFAQTVLPQEHQDAFVTKCRSEGITSAFSKELDLLKGKLRRQSVKFSSNVTIHAPSETFRDSIQILETSDDGWTRLRIRGTIEAMP